MPKRVQPYPIAQITGGLNVAIDPVFIADKESANLENVRFHKDLIKKDISWVNFANSNEEVLGIQEFKMKDATTWQVVHTPAGAYRVNANKTLTKLNAGNYTGNSDDSWDYITTLDSAGNEMYVFTNGRDPIQKWDGVGNTAANLGGWANITGRYLNSFKSRLFVGYTEEGGEINSLRIQWSVVGNAEDKANTGSGFVDLYDGTDPITGLVIVKNRLLVMREESIWEMLYTGGTNYFTPIKLFDGIGMQAPRSIGYKAEGIIFVGPNNVYFYDGASLQTIGDPVVPLLFETGTRIINGDRLNRMSGIFINELEQYWLCIPQGDYPDTVFKYDFKTKSWTRRDENGSAYGYWYSGAATPWEELTWTWANWAGPWVTERAAPKTPTILRGDHTGGIYEGNFSAGDANYAKFETKDWIFGHAHRLMEMRAQVKGGPFQMSYSVDGGNTWSTPANFAGNNSNFAEHSLQLNFETQKIRAKIETSNAEFQLKWIEPWYIMRARSQSILTS